MGAQSQQQWTANCPVLPTASQFQDRTLPPPPPLHHYSHKTLTTNGGLVEVMDILNRSMTNQYAILQRTLRQSQPASKEHYLSNGQSCDGRNPQKFGMWLDEVSQLATICDKSPIEVALAICKGTLNKYISKLLSSGLIWLPIKAQLQERFSECGSATMVKHKLTQLKQLELPMHEYITKFGDMAEHAYSIKPTNSASFILASNFIEGVQNPHIKNKLRSYQVTNLKDILVTPSRRTKQKIRALNFGVSPKLDPIPNCSITAIQGKGCFKCGSEDHFIKGCPLSQQNNAVPKGNYTGHRYDTKHDSMADKVMEPLTKLFTDFVAQLKLLTPSVQSSHNGPPNSMVDDRKGQGQMGFHHGHRQHANGNYHKQVRPNKDCHTDHCHGDNILTW